MKAMGGKGKFAIVSCGETAAQLNQWIDEIKKYSKAEVSRRPVGQHRLRRRGCCQGDADGNRHHERSARYQGIPRRVLDSRARRRAGRAECREDRKVFTVGMGTPNDMKKYLQNGCGVGRRLVGRKGSGLPDRVGWAAVGAGQAVPKRTAGRRVRTGQCHLRPREPRSC